MRETDMAPGLPVLAAEQGNEIFKQISKAQGAVTDNIGAEWLFPEENASGPGKSQVCSNARD